MSQLSKLCLVGVPDHQGVIHVGGRIGAAQGPQAFRRAFARLNGKAPLKERLIDLGDAPGLDGDVSANHRRAADLVRDCHAQGPATSVVVGGGHDHGYSHLLGIRDALAAGARKGRVPRLGCINIDPHLDVRKPDPKPTSGSPFYLALEGGVLDPRRFVEFGIQSHCNGPTLWDYVARKKVEVVPFEKLRGGRAVARFQQELKKLAARCDAVVVSLDLDSAVESAAPGVSAPQAEGFTGSELVQMAEIAGRSPKVVSLGLFELNPVHDIGDRTARLAATVAWHFLEQRV